MHATVAPEEVEEGVEGEEAGEMEVGEDGQGVTATGEEEVEVMEEEVMEVTEEAEEKVTVAVEVVEEAVVVMVEGVDQGAIVVVEEEEEVVVKVVAEAEAVVTEREKKSNVTN